MPLNSEYRVAIAMEHGSAAAMCWNTRNYRVTATDGTDTPGDLAISFGVLCAQKLQPLLPTSVEIVECAGSFSATPRPAVATHPINQDGTFPTTKFFPIQTSALIRLTYSGMSPRHPGRWFQPYLPMWPDASDYAAWVGAFQDLADFLFVDLPGSTTNDITYTPVVYHRNSGASSLLDTTPVRADYFYTQKRRAKDDADRTELVECVGPV